MTDETSGKHEAVSAAPAPQNKIIVSIHPTPKTTRAKQVELAAHIVCDEWNDWSAQ